MKTSLGTEVDLGPGHTVLDGTQLPLKRGTAASHPLFGPCLLWLRSPIVWVWHFISIICIALYICSHYYL